MAAVTLDAITVRAGGEPILDRVSLDVGDGELMAVVGPSGSGKTTLLRAIAGLDRIASGSVLIGDRDVTATPTRDRDVAMVLQDAVLYPFFTARKNIGFPLWVHDVSRDEIRRRVAAEARALEIEEILDRWPHQLAAGHQQLVQVARAMVRVPAVFLLDEPLARVEAGLRSRLRGELRILQSGYRVTTVYVTNDPAEAMAVGDRLVVMDGGRVQQVGAPLDVYRRPRSVFIAGLLGERPMCLVRVRIEGDVEGAWLVGGGGLRVRVWAPEVASHHGEHADLGVRAEDVELDPGGEVGGVVLRTESHGSHHEVELAVGDGSVWMRSDDAPPAVGTAVRMRLARWHLFSADDGSEIAHAG